MNTFWCNLWFRLGPAQEETYFAVRNVTALRKVLEKIKAAHAAAARVAPKPQPAKA